MTAKTNMRRTAGNVDQPGAKIQVPLDSASADDRRFLRALYLDCAGRPPLPQERAASEGRARGELAREVVKSQAFFDGFYEEELFYFLLLDNFRPSTDAFYALPKRMAAGKLSVRDALRQIVSSQFFDQRNPGNDTFVTVVLEQLLGMTVQKNVRVLAAGKRMYDGKSTSFLGVKGASQADVVRIAVGDERFEPFFLNRHFQRMFGTEMPASAMAANATRLRERPTAFPEIVAGWVTSAAYEERRREMHPLTDRVFIRALFVDLLGRAPSYQEFRRCRNALRALSDSGPLRSVLIKLMLDSDLPKVEELKERDPKKLITRLFLRFLRRPPTQSEEASFSSVLGQQQGTPKLLLRALLSHWEYQHY